MPPATTSRASGTSRSWRSTTATNGLLQLRKPVPGLRALTSAKPRQRSLKKIAQRPTGPEELGLGKSPLRHAGPGEPPVEFVGVWTSKTEWYVYWALCRILAPEKDPRKPPFVGVPELFVYQKQEMGGRVPGGSVTDFAIATPTGWIGLRVETERWHIWTTADRQMKDAFVKTHLASMQKTISIWDQHFIGDETGQEVIRVVALALKGVELPSPIKWGTAERVR